MVLALEHKVKAEVSKSKSIVLGSSASVRRRLAIRLAGVGIRVATRGKKLGCDFTLGGSRVASTARKRLSECLGRSAKFAALRRGAGR
eukprot:8069474-Heterocapsa_arctica.AAC.1